MTLSSGTRRPVTRSRERGVALFVTLMILMVITIMGIAAMRLGLGQSVISRNSMASNIVFQTAESAINAVIEEALTCSDTNSCEKASNVIGGAMKGVSTVRCLTTAGVVSVTGVDKCGYVESGVNKNYLDKNATIRAYAVTVMDGAAMVDGSDPSSMKNLRFKTEATAEITSLSVSTTHVQEFTRAGPGADLID